MATERTIALPNRLDRDALSETGLAAALAGVSPCDTTGVRSADGAGTACLWMLRRAGRLRGALDPEIEKALRDYDAACAALAPGRPTPRANPIEAFGRAECEVLGRWHDAVAYLGEVLASWGHLFSGRFRWGDCRLAFVRGGVQATPVMMLIGFLLGLILAFQSAIPLKMFGGEGFVGGLVGIALVRELGVLVAAILMAGRSGSAFAAELGTMKVNEEIDALETMGHRPVRFLVLPRVLAGTLALPMLALFVTLAGLIGGGVVMGVLGFSSNYYINQLQTFVHLNDLLGSVAKSFVFGFSVSVTGCWCGLRAGRDAGAVGTATTAAVVLGIVGIAVLEGIFSVVFYAMGW